MTSKIDDQVKKFIEKNREEIQDNWHSFEDNLIALAVQILRIDEKESLLHIPLDDKPTAYRIYKKIMEIGYPLLDHLKIHQTKDRVSLVSEPYNFHISDIEKLLKICKKEDIEFSINGYSHHYPGRCLRIYFYEKEKNKIAPKPAPEEYS